MKKYIIIFVASIFGCRQIEIDIKKKSTLINIEVGRTLNVDTIGRPIFKYKNDSEIILADTFKLKNNNKLIIFPTRINGKDTLNYRLINEKLDTVFNKFEIDNKVNMPLYYYDIKKNDKDFNNYFILTYTHNTHENYFILYDKRNCKSEFGLEMSRFSLKWHDLNKDLIIFEDCENNYKKYIYNLNKKNKTLIDPTKFKILVDTCKMFQNNWNKLYVKKISKDYYYLRGLDRCNPKTEFKLLIN